jgi:hypothetical protein
MAHPVPRRFVEYVLLGPLDDRRQLQNSPLLGDVWIAYAERPGTPRQLLIAPHKDCGAGSVAVAINDLVQDEDAQVAYLQGIVAACLKFEDVLAIVVPMTEWWARPSNTQALETYLRKRSGETRLANTISGLNAAWISGAERPAAGAVDRYVALAAILLWAESQPAPSEELQGPVLEGAFKQALQGADPKSIGGALRSVLKRVPAQKGKQMVWQVSLNREAKLAITRSVKAVKADAARNLFKVDCGEIAWAVIDSGIDADHEAFKDQKGKTRVKESYDFSNIREIVSVDNANDARRARRLDRLMQRPHLATFSREEADADLKELAEDARRDRAIDWARVTKFVELGANPEPVTSNHGTHVAGIIGASRKQAKQKASRGKGAGRKLAAEADAVSDDNADGMCPDIKLYDFRVLSKTLKETEFAIIAALQYIRYLNGQSNLVKVHGANLSLSIIHDVRNYACGRTPICNECERLVESGVVVVAAAGNLGYQAYQTREGAYEGYAAFTVTDPGNADGVITVGATHRYSPHTYGVSFFSSRGPTGDGRMKPDLVAPGERIRAPVSGGGWDDLDGTSMAAPHVSGAAAMLMARYSELIGQPRRIKRILCESATDLGRERSFQGNGMLDVLRAFQSV